MDTTTTPPPPPENYPPPPPAPGLAPPPSYRLHSPTAVACASFLGTPVAGGIVLALNYRKWGQKGRAAAAIAAGLLTTVVLGWLVWISPPSVPSAVFVTPQVVGGYLVARWLQGRHFDAHIAGGGKKATIWTATGVGLALFAPILAVIVLMSGINPGAIRDVQKAVDMGHEQYVYYSKGATEDDAEHFGEALQTEGYFDGTMPADVAISGKLGYRNIFFFADETMWDDETYLYEVRAMTQRIAPAIGGKPITVRILDVNWNEKKRLQIE
jgi:hypothetical protein